MSIPTRRALAAFLPLLGMGAALLSLAWAPPVYRGRCRVSMEPLAPGAEPAPTPEVLRSAAGREAIREVLAGAPQASGRPGEPSGPLSPPGAPAEGSASDPSAALLDTFLSRLSWTATETPAVYEILFDSPDPALAGEGANAAAAALERLFAPPAEDATALGARLRAVEVEIRFLAPHRDVDPGLLQQRRQATERALADLNEQYGRTRSARLDLEARWNALHQSAGSTSEWIDSPELEALREERTALVQQRDQLAVRFGPLWPEMKEISARLAAVDARLSEEARRLASEALRSAEAEYRQALAQEQALERSLRAQRREVRSLEEREEQHRQRQARLAALEAERTSLRARLAAPGGASPVPGRARILSPASSPVERRGWPAAARLAAGALIGLLLGVSAMRAAERLDPTLAGATDFEHALDAPLLAVLPEIPGGLPAGLLRLESAPPPGAEGPIDPLAAAARGFRDLRTGLLLARGGEPARMVLVTGCRRGEGKTSVAVHLALALARRGARVLIVDTHLQRPRAHRFFQAPAGPGLVDVLAGTVELEEAVRATEEAGLFLMPAGDVNGGSADLLDAASLRHLRDRLLQPGRFQHLVIDGGDVGTPAAPERLAVACSSVLMVARARRNVRGAVRQAAARLRRHGAPLLAGVWIGPEPPAGAPLRPPETVAGVAAAPPARAAGAPERPASRTPEPAPDAAREAQGATGAPSPVDADVMRRLEVLRSRLGRPRNAR